MTPKRYSYGPVDIEVTESPDNIAVRITDKFNQEQWGFNAQDYEEVREKLSRLVRQNLNTNKSEKIYVAYLINFLIQEIVNDG